MAIIAFTTYCVHVAAKNLDVSCGSLSVRIFVGMPKMLTQCSRKIVVTVVAVLFVVGMVSVNFEKRSVNATRYCLPLLVFGKRPRMSVAMNSSGSIDGNNRRFRWYFLLCGLRALDF